MIPSVVSIHWFLTPWVQTLFCPCSRGSNLDKVLKLEDEANGGPSCKGFSVAVELLFKTIFGWQLFGKNGLLFFLLRSKFFAPAPYKRLCSFFFWSSKSFEFILQNQLAVCAQLKSIKKIFCNRKLNRRYKTTKCKTRTVKKYIQTHILSLQ